MMNSVADDIRITYAVRKSHLEHALGLLGKAQRTTRRVHRFLSGAAFVFFTLALASVLVHIFELKSGAGGLSIVAIILSFLTFGAGVLLVIAFLAGLALMGIHWWFARRLSKLGLGRVALIPSSMKARSLRILGALCTPIGVLCLCVGVIMFAPLWPGESQPQATDGPSDMTAIGILFAIGLLLTLPHFISCRRRHRTLMRRIDNLERQLSPYLAQGTADEMVDIAVEDLNLLARFEAAQIERERAKAVAEARREARADDYVLLTSRRATDAMGQLPAEVRVHAQEAAVELTHEPKPENAIWDESAGSWRLVMPDSRIQLNYLIDDAQHQIKLLSVARMQEEHGVEARGDQNDD